MYKHIILFFLLSITGLNLFGQQDPHYSQYMFNGLILNPAYAGSRSGLSLTLLGRYQWAGIPGAPRNATISVHGPSVNDQHGYGGTVYFDQLGITSQVAVQGNYAFRMALGPGTLALGLVGGVMSHTNRWSDAITADPDGGVALANQSAILPMVGTGAYYYSDRFYAGVSIPNLIPNLYKNPATFSGDIAARQQKHYFTTVGLVLPIREGLDFRPSLLWKVTANAPMQLDLTASFVFRKAFGVGFSYRTADSMVFLLEYFLSNKMRVGYSYDLTLSSLNQYTSGTHEIMFGLDLGWSKDRVITPRFF